MSEKWLPISEWPDYALRSLLNDLRSIEREEKALEDLKQLSQEMTSGKERTLLRNRSDHDDDIRAGKLQRWLRKMEQGQ